MTSADVLRALTERVVLSWPFHQEVYPRLAELDTEEKRRQFAFEHISLHFMKMVGNLATAVESGQHGKPIDTAELRLSLVKCVGNALRLAAILDMPTEELLSLYQEAFQKGPPLP